MADVGAMLQVRLTPRAVVVILECAELMSAQDITTLDAELSALLDDEQRPHLVIDFHKVRSISSSALGYLVKLRNVINDKGGRLRLCCVAQKVKDSENDTYIYELFKIVHLDKFFELAPNVEAALANLP
ncbi:MAG: STAS domain-containing protein [Sedimentisphaerales bacterium]|nr:STAS domain-containing protein [Sedimentisphaerales bacterium]